MTSLNDFDVVLFFSLDTFCLPLFLPFSHITLLESWCRCWRGTWMSLAEGSSVNQFSEPLKPSSTSSSSSFAHACSTPSECFCSFCGLFIMIMTSTFFKFQIQIVRDTNTHTQPSDGVPEESLLTALWGKAADYSTNAANKHWWLSAVSKWELMTGQVYWVGSRWYTSQTKFQQGRLMTTPTLSWELHWTTQ